MSIIVGALVIFLVVFFVIILPLWIGDGNYGDGIAVVICVLGFIFISWVLGESILNPSIFN